jgi:beta-glucanase (GH16 family)/GR25 family glycosyltransferase involved in LPS biosynthesis
MNLNKRKVSKLAQLIRNVKRIVFHRSKSNIFGYEDAGQTPKIHKAFVINLDRQPVRWKRFKREARIERTSHQKNLFNYCERVSAVDGSKLTQADMSPSEIEIKYDLKDHYFVDPDPRLTQIVKDKDIMVDMSEAEIAVALSHLKVWRKIVEEKIPYALVFEDDVAFEENFATRANNAWQELPEAKDGSSAFDILYFSYSIVENGLEKLDYSNSLYRPIRGLWWLSAYVVSYEGAQKLLQSLPICGPVDMWLNLKFPILNVFATSESIIGQRKDWGSDNEYSILPLLSRAGIHHHEAPIKHSGRKPVFAIGLNKTGTTSLHFALTSLGYKSCHFLNHDFSDNTAKLIDNGETLPYEAYTDVASVVSRFRQLDEQYPDAAFILTTRELDSWVASRSRHVLRNRRENAAGASHTWTLDEPEVWKLEREQHHDAVFSYFEDKPDKLLALDICGGDGWEPLCNFLECPVPEELFPYVDPLIMLNSFSRNLVKKVPIVLRKSKVREFDDLPWIEKPKNWSKLIKSHIGEFAKRTGSFSPDYTDSFETFNKSQWSQVTDTFGHNLAQFQPQNLALLDGGGFSMELRSEKTERREYSSASICSKSSQLYGRFEAEMKPAKANGMITALFLYRFDPWQEIDIEFFGKDTSKIMVNVYYNPGEEGTISNEGVHGTPVQLDLGFDAADDYHRYAIEWDPNEIRWFVDDQLVHVRRSPIPVPIPDLPMKCYFNTWPPSTMKDLAGDLDDSQLPVKSYVRSFIQSSWIAPEVKVEKEEQIEELTLA